MCMRGWINAYIACMHGKFNVVAKWNHFNLREKWFYIRDRQVARNIQVEGLRMTEIVMLVCNGATTDSLCCLHSRGTSAVQQFRPRCINTAIQFVSSLAQQIVQKKNASLVPAGGTILHPPHGNTCCWIESTYFRKSANSSAVGWKIGHASTPFVRRGPDGSAWPSSIGSMLLRQAQRRYPLNPKWTKAYSCSLRLWNFSTQNTCTSAPTNNIHGVLASSHENQARRGEIARDKIVRHYSHGFQEFFLTKGRKIPAQNWRRGGIRPRWSNCLKQALPKAVKGPRPKCTSPFAQKKSGKHILFENPWARHLVQQRDRTTHGEYPLVRVHQKTNTSIDSRKK